MIDIQQYNPYPSFQPGQAEAIQQMLDLHESGARVVELNAPTAAGKSLDLFVLGRILTEELQVGRVAYTTPLVALVNQLQDNAAFEKMPILKGKRNYPCGLLRGTTGGWQSAEDCRGAVNSPAQIPFSSDSTLRLYILLSHDPVVLF